MFEMLVDTLFTEVAEHQHVVLLQLLSNDPGQNRFVVWDEVILTLFLAHGFLLLLLFEFVKNFYEGVNIVVRLFAERQVDKCESVEGSV